MLGYGPPTNNGVRQRPLIKVRPTAAFDAASWQNPSVAVEAQECSEPGCVRPAAFKTRTNPAWCDEHITVILRSGGLEPLEPFDGPKKWRLTRCLACGCEAHYRFEYTLSQNAVGIGTCRACFWRSWAAQQRGAPEGFVDQTPPSITVAKGYAEQHGLEYLGPLTHRSLRDDPHRTRCNYCGRIAAQRLGTSGGAANA